ncbi:hypothetical protein NL360_28815, partial [Klebsiella pneumoniae]|nr:hypothetical protein [Klebsiella pneumoniae]
MKGTTPSLDLAGEVSGMDLKQLAPGRLKGTLRSRFTLKGTAAKPQVNFTADVDRLDAAQFGAKNLQLS